MGRPKKNKEVEQPVKAAIKSNNNVVVQAQPVFNKRGVKSLDELTGDKFSPYGHQTEEQYLDYLNNLNLMDLQVHAGSLSILPKEDRRAMINLLIREFKLRSSDYYNSAVIQPAITKPISDEVLKILAEGR